MKKESCRAITNSAAFLLKIFERPQDAWPSPKVAILGAWGLSLNKHFGRCNPAKIAKHVYVCIACQYVKSLILMILVSAHACILRVKEI